MHQSRHGGDLALSLPKQRRHLGRVVGVAVGQHVGCDLARGSVYGKMELAPRSARSAMLLCVPLSLSEQFQAGAVQHEVDGTCPAHDTRMPAGERPASSAQRRMVGHGQLKSEQAQDAASDPSTCRRAR